MGFGDFMKGMQGGMTTMQDLRRQRQLDELYDYAIADEEGKFGDRNDERVENGLEPFKKRGSTTLLGRLTDKMDPVLARWMEKLGRGSGTTESPDAALQPTAEETDTTPTAVPESYAPEETMGFGFADGGALPEQWDFREDAKAPSGEKARPKMTEEEFARRRAAAKADLTGKADQIRPVEHTSKANQKVINRVGADVTPKSAIPDAPPKSLARRVGGKLVKGAAVGSILAGASGGIRGALDAETTGEGVLSDLGQRALGAGKGILTGVLDPLGEPGRWMDRGEEAPAAIPEAAPAPAEPGQPVGPRSRRYPGQQSAPRPAAAPAAPGPQAVPTAPAEEDPLANFDISQFKAEEIPNFSNNDWVDHRQKLLKSYMRQGLSYAEAWDKTDQQVVATQQRGFMHFAKQAYTALATSGKSSPQAAAAVRAAFQYLPSTTDIQVGEYNGHLVAFGVDEDTGEQVGTPIVITPKLLEQVMMNFQDPKAWAEHAQDNRKLDQADRELDQGDRRLGIMEGGLQVERENALTKRIDAIGTGGGNSALKQSDIAAAGKYIDDWAFQFQSEDADPALPSALAALAEAEFARKGGGDYQLRNITLRLEEMLKSPGGAEMIIAAARRLASGQ